MATRKDEINRLKKWIDVRFEDLLIETELLKVPQMLKAIKQEMVKHLREFKELEPK